MIYYIGDCQSSVHRSCFRTLLALSVGLLAANIQHALSSGYVGA
jgi:hypothetical protein